MARTQTERSAATKARLCAAAIQSLTERGHAGATTADIAGRAGVSQGALFRHYPTKAALFADAAESLYDQVRATVRRRLTSAGKAENVVAASVRALWKVFRLPAMTASYELVMAARTDAALREALRPVLQRNTAANVALAAELLPAGLASPAAVNLVIWAVQGAAMDAFVGVSDQEITELIDMLTALSGTLP